MPFNRMLILMDRINNKLEIIKNQPADEFGTETLYIAKNGDGSDGLSWDTAFTGFEAAYEAASNDIGDLTEIVVGPGTYDLNYSGFLSPGYKNIFIRGLNRKSCIIRNTHPGAGAVLDFTHSIRLKNLTIRPNEFTEGIRLDHGADYSYIEDVDIFGDNKWYSGYRDGPSVGIMFDGVRFCGLRDVEIKGERGTTYGMRFSPEEGRKCSHIQIRDIYIDDCQYGIYGNVGSMSGCRFKNFDIHDGLYGVHLSSGCVDNEFENIKTHNIQTFITIDWPNIHDYGDGNHFTNIDVDPDVRKILPTGTTGTTLTTGAGVGAWGAWVDLEIPTNKPFIPLLLILNDPGDDATWRIEVRRTDNEVMVSEKVFTTISVNYQGHIEVRLEYGRDKVYKKNTGLEARVMNNLDAADTIDAFLKYKAV